MARVRHWESIEVNDFVFVWYHAENEEPSWRPEPMEKITGRRWWYRGRSEYLINSHIQVTTSFDCSKIFRPLDLGKKSREFLILNVLKSLLLNIVSSGQILLKADLFNTED